MPTTHDKRLDELMRSWQERRLQGDTLSAADLCRDCPELAEELRSRLEQAQQADRLTPVSTTLEAMQTSPPSEDEDAPPPTVDGYTIEGKLGKGGMSIVYLALQHALPRLVALKMLRHPWAGGLGEVDRFRREVDALARLEHPNIISVYEVREQQGVPVLSMEYAAGGSLSMKLGGKPIHPREAARLVEVLARAMQAVHNGGTVHRDLKPSNVLLTADGIPKIADFGLAKRLEGDPTETPSGAILGTPSYMAPEQAAGNKEVCPLADVYALGAILYECLTGRPPFRANTQAATLTEVLTRLPVPIRRLQPSVPRALEAVCLKCLEKAPSNRYGSAAELADDLNRWLAGQAPARIPSLGGRVLLQARRHWVACLAGLCLLVGLTVALICFPESPEKELERILQELERGETVTLVRAAGPPRWHRWLVGSQSSSPSVSSRPFTCGSYSVGLIELLPRVPALPFSISFEVRQDEMLEGGYTGIYFALSSKDGSNGAEYIYYQLVLSDNYAENVAMAPRIEFRRIAEKGPRGPVDVHVPLLVSARPAAQPRPIGPRTEWRKLKLVVSPERLQVWQETDLLQEYNVKEVEGQLQVFRRVQGIDPSQPVLPAQGSLGLCVYRADVSFRSVVVEPIGEK